MVFPSIIALKKSPSCPFLCMDLYSIPSGRRSIPVMVYTVGWLACTHTSSPMVSSCFWTELSGGGSIICHVKSLYTGCPSLVVPSHLYNVVSREPVDQYAHVHCELHKCGLWQWVQGCTLFSRIHLAV